MTRGSFCDSTCFSWSIPELLCTSNPLRNLGCCTLERFYLPFFRNGKDRTWNGVERWNIFWNAFRNVGTLLERFLERVPECFWNAPGMRYGTLERSNPNAFGKYLEILERFSNVPGKFGTFLEHTSNKCSTHSRTSVPERSRVPEHCYNPPLNKLHEGLFIYISTVLVDKALKYSYF